VKPLPDVTILIISYNRPKQLQQTLDALADNLIYPREHLRWILADDCSPDADVKRVAVANGLRYVSPAKNSGLGVNNNTGLSAVETEYVFQVPDHVFLQKPLDLRIGVAVLEARKDIGLLRYSSTFNGMFGALESADVSAYAPEHAAGGYKPGLAYFWTLYPDTFYIYSDWPHLKHRRFHAYYGTYNENTPIHDVEFGMANHVSNCLRQHPDQAPKIALMDGWADWAWEHQQEFSYQAVKHAG
jgi:glycosyltransferase involved in cell wall biosynthesis